MIEKGFVLLLFGCLCVSAFQLAGVTLQWIFNRSEIDPKIDRIASFFPFIIFIPSFHAERVQDDVRKKMRIFAFSSSAAIGLFYLNTIFNCNTELKL